MKRRARKPKPFAMAAVILTPDSDKDGRFVEIKGQRDFCYDAKEIRDLGEWCIAAADWADSKKGDGV
jgi:hypothetical protein